MVMMVTGVMVVSSWSASGKEHKTAQTSGQLVNQLPACQIMSVINKKSMMVLFSGHFKSEEMPSLPLVWTKDRLQK